MSGRICLKRRWRVWTVFDPDEPVGTFDGYTYYRSLTREGAIAKWRKAYERNRPFAGWTDTDPSIRQASK